MSKSCSKSAYLHWIADKEKQQINSVDPLIHQNTAAIYSPGSPPCTAVIVFLRAEPFELSISKSDCSKTPFIDGFFQQQRGILETTLENTAKADMVRLCLFDQLRNTFFGYFHRLFNQNVFSCTNCSQCRIREGGTGWAPMCISRHWDS